MDGISAFGVDHGYGEITKSSQTSYADYALGGPIVNGRKGKKGSAYGTNLKHQLAGSGIGAAGGAGLGAAIGAARGKSGKGALAGGIIGSIPGSVAGSVSGYKANQRKGNLK